MIEGRGYKVLEGFSLKVEHKATLGGKLRSHNFAKARAQRSERANQNPRGNEQKRRVTHTRHNKGTSSSSSRPAQTVFCYFYYSPHSRSFKDR
jgi:hypothetical protein